MPATFTRAATRVGALLTAAALLVVGAPATARAQTTTSGAKALVYCPVGVDVAGCDQIVQTLTGTAAFPGGVARAYDGTSGTVALAYVTLSQYAVLVVPSLADDSTHSPYAVLRSAVVQSHLKAGVTGRIAVWGGTPDLGSDATTRPAKDQLLRNLASWGATDWAVAGTTGLVVLADLSADAARRYDWLAGVSRLALSADPELYGFDAATPINGTGKEILRSSSTSTTPLAYANMASFGLLLPSSSIGVVGATGTATDSAGATVTSNLLVTSAGAGNTGAATIKTDRTDYLPGMTVTFTGSGWTPGETVSITLHENPTEHADVTLTAVADSTGAIMNDQYAPEAHDVGVTYYVTAKGGTSGLIAQTSFTDGNATVSGFVRSSAAGNPAIAGATVQCTTGCNGSASTTTAADGSYSLAVQFSGNSGSVTLSASATNFGTGTTTVSVSNGQNVNRNFSLTPSVVATSTIVASSANPSTFGTAVTFTATVTASGGNPSNVGTVAFSDGATAIGGCAAVALSGNTATCTTSTLTVAGSPHSITATYSGATGFSGSSGSLSQTVDKATPTITWANPADITYGTALSATQLNATASVPGAFVYTPAAGAVLNAGAGQTLGTTFTPTDGTNYNTATKTVALNVLQASQTITFVAPSGVKFGDADIVLGATASSSLTVGYASSTTGVCTIVSGNLLHVVAAGSCSVTASQAGNTNYAAATPVTQTFAIAAKPVVVTPSSGQSKTYGTADPALTFTNDGGLAVGDFTGALGRTAGENVGAYAINIGSLSAGTNYSLSLSATPVTFAITRATPTFSNLSAPHVTYGATAATITGALKAGSIPATGSVSITVAGTGGSLSASSVLDASGNFAATVNPSGLPANAAGYAITLSYAQTSNFEAASDNSLSLVVDKAGQTISFGALGAKTFGDADFSVSATATSGLAVSFAATGDCTVGGSTVHLTGAGSCTITASQAGDGNYDAATSVPQTFSIGKASSTVLVSCPSTPVTYTGAAQTPCTATATGAGGLSVTLTPSYTNNTNVGTASVSATFAGDANHTGSSNTGSFEISKANPVVAAAGGSFTYTGSPQAGSGTATGVLSEDLGAVTLSYSGTGTTTYGPTATPPTDAGSYSVTASFAGSTNYNPGSSSAAALTIAKAASAVTVTCPSTPQTYTGAAQTPCTARATGAGGLDVAVTPVTHTDNVNVGTASASATFAGDANHDGSTGTGSFTIVKAASTTTVTVADIEYSGLPQGGSATVTGVGGLSQSLAVSYSGRNGTTYGPSTTAPTNAGFYTASASFGGDANHDGSTDSKDYQITKATLTITGPTLSREYGEANPNLDGTFSGAKNSETFTVTGTTPAVATSPVGDYAIVPAATGTTIGNYTVAPVNGKLTVTAAPLTVTTAAKTKVYGDANPTLTGSIGGIKNSDNITATYATTATVASAVGPYPITATLVDPDHKLGNYTVTNAGNTLTVTAAPLTVTVDPQTKIQGAPLPTFTGSVTGIKNGDAITASYTTTATDMSPPGSYLITATLADPGSKLGNYTITNPGGTLTVTVNQPPSITATASPDPVQVGSSFTLNMVLSDVDPAASTPYAVTIDWGDGKPAQSFQTTATGALTKSYGYAAAGVYTVNVSVTDKVNTSATGTMKATYQYAVIYDPNGGFVTGGGWINSPAGAYAADPALAGKATFGFVSKYQKGATIPSGNTEFQFQAAGFNFKSTSYEWLTISGSRAQYKGSGTINGSGDYGFLLTGIDGDVSGGGGTDKFRIKVWNKTTSAVIYDNQMGMDDTGTPTTVLGGGSIVIHTK